MRSSERCMAGEGDIHTKLNKRCSHWLERKLFSTRGQSDSRLTKAVRFPDLGVFRTQLDKHQSYVA